MKRICTLCDRMTVDGNLWCLEPDCPAGNMPVIFDYGEWLGDIQVVRLLRVLRSSAVYEAQRNEKLLLLKVAHNGCQDQLRLEANIMAQMSKKRQHPMLPVLLPAYQQADIAIRPYGKTMFRGETKYYTVFEHAEGEFLHDLLLKNPQPWFQHAVWITTQLADLVAAMHILVNRLHLNLTPNAIFVRHDKDKIPRPLVLDLGLMNEQGTIDPAWVTQYAEPAYTPPEVVAGTPPPTRASDVYALGLLLYEMLAGHPAFHYAQRRDEDVRRDVVQGIPVPLERTDLAKEIHEIVQQAIHLTPDYRQQDIRVFAKQLRQLFGEVPAERKPKRRRNLAVVVIAAMFLVVVWIMLAAMVG